MKIVLILFAAYFLGSIPSAYLMAKWTRGIDIRQHGSGNVGFTNALRTIGKGPAILVLAADVGKGIVAVLLAKHFGNPMLVTLAGLLVLVGHNYPVCLGFKGGKGAAAGFGVLVAMLPAEGLLAVTIWILVILITRYVSLGTILAGLSVPISVLFFGHEPAYLIFAVFGAGFVIFKHHSNIARLLKGTERKIGEKDR